MSALVRQIAVHLIRVHTALRRADELELSRVGLIDRRLRRAMEFMHDNCSRDLRLAEIAAQSHLSAFHFVRLFKKLTDTTPFAYLAALRIEKSRRLLAETSLSLSEVGARVGYESQSHFTRVFRQSVGMTPRAYREASRDVRD
jgi:AraC family transcriptional regulator